MKKYIADHLERNNLLSSPQHGFRIGRSRTTQLLEYFEKLEDAVDSEDHIDVVNLDYRKAFDAVPHLRLLEKVRTGEIGGDIVRWIKSLLGGRVQRVAIRKTYSQWREVWSGMSQGSGPTLLLVYIDDLMDNENPAISCLQTIPNLT